MLTSKVKLPVMTGRQTHITGWVFTIIGLVITRGTANSFLGTGLLGDMLICVTIYIAVFRKYLLSSMEDLESKLVAICGTVGAIAVFAFVTKGWPALLALDAVPIVIGLLLWGLLQEIIYRGLVQHYLAKRVPPVMAILIANIIFTFGTIHFKHVLAGNYVTLSIIFLTGLGFGFLYHRYKNIYVVGLFHGIGDVFLMGGNMM
jgi:membrane protease YdiL (CAAX protease family)